MGSPIHKASLIEPQESQSHVDDNGIDENMMKTGEDGLTNAGTTVPAWATVIARAILKLLYQITIRTDRGGRAPEALR